MREYGKVAPSFWVGDTGKRFRGDPEAQVVALYLATGPHATMTGLYYLALPTLAHETGLTLEGASKALRRVCESGFADFDESEEVVFVPEMARYQIADTLKPKDKRIIGIVKEVERFKKTRFYAEFFNRYSGVFHLPKPSPFEGPSKPLRSQEQEQEQDQDLSQKASANQQQSKPEEKRLTLIRSEVSKRFQALGILTPDGYWIGTSAAKIDAYAEAAVISAHEAVSVAFVAFQKLVDSWSVKRVTPKLFAEHWDAIQGVIAGHDPARKPSGRSPEPPAPKPLHVDYPEVE